MKKRDFITDQQVQELERWLDYLMSDCGWNDETLDIPELIQVIEEDDLLGLLYDLENITDYRNSYQYEEGLKQIWYNRTIDYFENYDELYESLYGGDDLLGE